MVTVQVDILDAISYILARLWRAQNVLFRLTGQCRFFDWVTHNPAWYRRAQNVLFWNKMCCFWNKMCCFWNKMCCLLLSLWRFWWRFLK